MVIWVSTAALVIVLVAIVRSEIRCDRKAKERQLNVNNQINELARSTFDRHRDLFGREPTGAFPIFDATGDIKK